MQRNSNPRTSLRRLSELRSLALGAAVGAILADPHGHDPQLERTARPTRLLAVAATHYWHS